MLALPVLPVLPVSMDLTVLHLAVPKLSADLQLAAAATLVPSMLAPIRNVFLTPATHDGDLGVVQLPVKDQRAARR